MILKKLLLFIGVVLFSNSYSQRDFSQSDITKLVMLGSGNPNPSPIRSGCSIAVVVKEKAYIVDFGAGVVRQAAAMSPKYGGKIKALDTKNIKTAFLTHLHSDHTVGYPDLILTPWVMGRNSPLEVYGPEGLNKMTTNILEAYEDDIKYRLYGTEPANNQGWRVNAHEFSKEGVVYSDSLVSVEAFRVPHGSWPNSWGFRFTTPDKVIVISGDSAPSETIVKYSKNADILVHEVYSKKGFDVRSKFWQNYHSKQHTSTIELGEIASKAKPKLVVLYHVLDWGATEKEMLNEISTKYSGKVIVSRDLDIY